ncbi:MAG: aldehyde dehydrogenase [Rhizobiales bacterium]|nr:aldehyde dehydrogenase [Hyphomicrobiales bacterium]
MSKKLLDRRAVVARLMRDRGDTLVIAGLGSATYDLAAAGDDPKNFYLWGAMGGAAMMGLGLALAQPKRPVVVLTGDGEALMGLGGFATIALQKPKNLSVVILDNGLYGETGAQATHTAGGADIAKIAAACGIAETRTVTTIDEVGSLSDRITRIGEGPLVAVVKIDAASPPRVLPSRDGAWLKGRFRQTLGLAG